MSGGVDSSLTAALLVEQGYSVTGVYMKNWTRDLPGMACPWAEDLADAKRVAVQLGIPFKVFDFETDYKRLVVDYMIEEYRRGRTPNPDVMCNQEVKFGLFLKAALSDGADLIATGHYARVGVGKSVAPVSDAVDFDVEKSLSRISESSLKNGFSESLSEPTARSERSEPGDIPIPGSSKLDSGGDPVARSAPSASRAQIIIGSKRPSEKPPLLIRARDENKDQTYFLYRITAEALSKTLFPIGHLTKPEVRAEAKKRGLLTAGRRDSQGICFVGNVGIREFLSQFVTTQPGPIIEQETGQVLGRHDGAIFYTFGQRHNLGVGGGLPYYVVGKDMDKNEVYVSSNLNNGEFWRSELKLTDTHWINQPPEAGKTYQVRLRHRAPLLECKFNNNVVKLTTPERAIAPGQSAVIYDGQIVLGGGIVI
jgi:tRNA-specific 2-thiouridylase